MTNYMSSEAQGYTTLAGARVLLAEDQALVRDTLRRLLRDQRAELDVAHSGREALGFLSTPTAYDLFVVDQMMPEITGLEVVKLLRADELASVWSMPVILITGHSDPPVIKAAKTLDIDAVLAKPFSTGEFLNRANAVLRKPRPKRSAEHYGACALPSALQIGARETPVGPAAIIPGKPLWYTSSELRGTAREPAQDKGRLVALNKLTPGMILAQNIHYESGVLLAGPGIEISERLIHKIAELARDNEDYRFILVHESRTDT